jgi:cytochrome b
MNKIPMRDPMWDIPERIFHWAFAASIIAAQAIGFLVDDDV